MPKDQAERVVEGAMHLHRIWAYAWWPPVSGRTVGIHPRNYAQDLKIEIERLTVQDAMKAASFLAGVVLQGSRPPNGRSYPKRVAQGIGPQSYHDPDGSFLALVFRGFADRES